MNEISKKYNYFKSVVYLSIKNKKLLKFLIYFTKIGNIPLQGKIFQLTFNESNILFYVPKNHLELAEAILHFQKSDTDCKEIIKYFDISRKIIFKKRFLDLGANQGLYSLALKKNNFDTLSVEGNHELANVLKINYLLNGYTSEVDVLEKWVIPNLDSNYYKHESDFSLTNSVKNFGQNKIFNKITLAQLLFEFKPSLVKLDLEGLDSEIILSTKYRDYEGVVYIVIEQDINDVNVSNVEDHLKSMGFLKSLTTNLQGELVVSRIAGLTNVHYVRI
jgi:FkbM family methyltransferase